MSATLVGSSLLGSSVQTYAVAALLSRSAALSYKGAAYVGALVFAATSVPTVSFSIPQISVCVMKLVIDFTNEVE